MSNSRGRNPAYDNLQAAQVVQPADVSATHVSALPETTKERLRREVGEMSPEDRGRVDPAVLVALGM